MGVCRPDAVPELPARLGRFVGEGFHGQMGWLARRMGWRARPDLLWPEARSVVMLAESYTPEADPMAALEARDHGTVSVYAQGRDYHDLVKKRLKRVGRWMIENLRDDAYRDAQSGKWVPLSSLDGQATAPAAAPPKIKVFVDTAPVPEKALGQAAGLGWQGKHTNLLGREIGNWVFLGAIFTTLELEVDAPEVSHCGSCTACLDVCPTRAFPAPYLLDARRCISYLTIEHKGPVAHELRALMGNRIYGCDDCLAVCPWNKFAVEASEMRYRGAQNAPLEELAVLDDSGFRARFSGSPIKRIGRGRFVRNVLYAIGNSGDGRLRPVAQGLCEDMDQVVADAARWAVERLRDAPDPGGVRMRPPGGRVGRGPGVPPRA